MKTFILALLVVAVCVATASAQTTPVPTQKLPTLREKVEVTATRLPEDPNKVPAPIQVINSDELGERGTLDLRSALGLATGVEVAPGGDAGPASAVPDFWGLKEFDAFLLVVDGVPRGGAFNPGLTSLDLNDVERIEVLRGPASVTYGATSFVGALHVQHQDAATKGRTLNMHGGSFGSGGGAFSTPLPLGGRWASRLTLNGERVGFNDDRTAYRRGHGLWRVSRKPTERRVWFDADMNWLDQDPASPRARSGATLSPLSPVDANYHPAGAFVNDHRLTGSGGFDREIGGTQWFTTGSVSHDRVDLLRGFLTVLDEVPNNAHGVREKINLTDVYADSHVAWKLPRSARLVLGGDYLHGAGKAKGADFNYTVPLSGAQAVRADVPPQLDVTIDDKRNLFGGYGLLEWNPLDRLRFDVGLRLNVAHESRRDADPGAGRDDSSSRTDTHLGASIGAIYTVWQHDQDGARFFVDYRDTFKPASIDFGIGESLGGKQILDPETSRSVDGGIKGNFLNRRLELEATGFFMDFSNLVTATSVHGVPALINAGESRFKGFETEGSVYLRSDVVARATYSFHDATFTDFVQDFGGVPTQLAGKRLEMSAHHLAAVGLYYTPERGFLGGVTMNYTGSRFLDKRNGALAEGFATVGVNAGYRTPRWEVRADALNLGNRRDPVAQSEFGDAQYYLMTNRRVDVSLTLHF